MSPTRQSSVAQADIVTEVYDPAPAVGRYQGNGRFGGVYSRLGLHAHPEEKAASDAHGVTQFTHLQHWGRFSFFAQGMQADTTADYILPLARIYWETTPVDVRDYRQAQSFYTGTLHTTFRCGDETQLDLTTWFDPVRRDLAALRLQTTGRPAPLILAVPTGFRPYTYGYNEPATQRFSATCLGDQWLLEITCATSTPPAVSRLFVSTNAAVEPCAEGLRIVPPPGECTLLLGYGAPVSEIDAVESLPRTQRWWSEVWERSGWFEFPEVASQRMWIRSLAYILSSFNDDGLGFVSTNGLTGNLFPFNFAQDLFYVHPVLLATGHVGVAKAWIERFRGMLDGMKAYAKHLWPEVEGIYPPWELPYGPIEGYHTPSVPIIYCYEPHNAAYLARMAHETGLMLDDAAWTECNVVPLVRETALFYKSFCRKEADGHWHLFLTPSVGQDEAGGRHQRDYLCALYSARYAFQTAIAHGLDGDGAYRRILDDGLAFPALLSPHGYWYASAGSGEKDFGRQKHPVQLNGLAYLPVEAAPLGPERIAYARRYETTKQAAQPYFYGWTLGEFLLAGTHLGDAAGWSRDWSSLRPANYTDEGGVQLYETSGTTHQSFYVTTHGLVAQSLAGNVMNDYWGDLRINGNRVHAGRVRFGNVRSLLGVTVSGEVDREEARVTLVAWNACTLTVNGMSVTLRPGETRTLRLPSPT